MTDDLDATHATRRIVALEDDDLQQLFAATARDLGWRVTFVEDLDALIATQHNDPHVCTIVDARHLAVDDLDALGGPRTFVGARAPSADERVRWMTRGARDVVPWPCEQVEQVRTVCALIELVVWPHASTAAGAQERDSELLIINALAHALATSVDESTIIAKAVSVLAGAFRKGAIAYLRVLDEDELIEETPPLGLFSESEVSEVEADLHHKDDAASREYHLAVAEQFAADRLLVSLYPGHHPSWQRLLEEQDPVVLFARPEVGMYPGLEPLWHRLSRGVIMLAPVSGRTAALGVLVVAELDLLDGHDPPLSVETLQAVAVLLGSALENARLFDEATQAYESLRAAQDQLISSEKFAAVGHLSAQVAHEINNPSSFVISNLSVMLDYVATIAEFFEEMKRRATAGQRQRLATLMREHEIDFLQEDLHKLLNRSLAGMQRIHQIIQDLRYLAHDSGPELSWVDVEGLLDASLNLVTHDIKYRAHIERKYAGVPNIFSDANRLSQVFLNLLVNASQALANGGVDEDVLTVGTIPYGDGVLIFIEDTGEGIRAEDLHRIFEPFFTTKRRGEGTGLGLSLSRDILHALGGDIRAFSEAGEGGAL